MASGNAVIDEVLRSDLVDDPARAATAHPANVEHTARRRLRWSRDASLASIALGSLGGFLVLSRVIAGRRATLFDRGVMRAMGRARHPWSDALIRGLTFFGSVGGAGSLSFAAVVLARHKPRVASQLAVGALGGISAELVIKRFFHRKRPTLLPHLEDVTSTSFPSGHSTAAASIYLTMAFVASRSRSLRSHRGALLAAAGIFASSVGASRVYLGVHWPTDVISGLAIGTAWACASEAIYDLTGASQVQRDCARGRDDVLKPPTSPDVERTSRRLR